MRIATRCPNMKASLRSWVTNTVVIPVSRSIVSKSRISPSRVGGSKAEKGSSNRRSSGLRTRARTRLVRCASPPERLRAGRCAR